MLIQGKIVKGTGIATYTIEKQKPYFEKFIPNIMDVKPGTINLNISPASFKIKKFAYLVEKVLWDEEFPIEDFGFIPITKLLTKNQEIISPGYVYIPNKSPHFQNNSQLELVCRPMEVTYGDKISIEVEDQYIEVAI